MNLGGKCLEYRLEENQSSFQRMNESFRSDTTPTLLIINCKKFTKFALETSRLRVWFGYEGKIEKTQKITSLFQTNHKTVIKSHSF